MKRTPGRRPLPNLPFRFKISQRPVPARPDPPPAAAGMGRLVSTLTDHETDLGSQMPIKPLAINVLALFLTVTLVGCGANDGDRPARVPATGTVLLDDQPLADATVVFIPQDHSYGATARTDDSGRFQLQTFETADGAVPGTFQVTVRKFEMEGVAPGQFDDPNASDDGGDDDDDGGNGMPRGGDETEAPTVVEKSLIPERYGKPGTSELVFTVSEGADNDFVLELVGR